MALPRKAHDGRSVFGRTRRTGVIVQHPAAEADELPSDLRALLQNASISLDAAARHIEQLQSVVRVVVKETPAGHSLDLERSQPSYQ